ncbi:MAG: Rpn family recombination-promoting nuclease/putative transposase [Prevotellaceae bacterium]|jgi:predicted transposase/invertase (TIGR01784 family)|nr:Rpn family recombination-promoting nuclease/putative transposase [Prevotellaceae bacterium]
MAKDTGKTKASKSIETPVFMNIKTDFGFKKIFGNKVLLIGFLNAILNRDIVEIEYLPAEQLGYIEENRKAVYDVYCTTENGERFIVEMQASPQVHFADRIVFYMSYPVLAQAPKGLINLINSAGEEIRVPWDYALRGVYMICILDNIMFPEEKARDIVMERIKIVRQEAETVLTDKWEAVTIELPKFTKTEDGLETAVDKWIYSLKNMEKLPERPEKLNEKIFDELYEYAKINKLKKEDMKEYGKSVLEYDDVISSLRYVEERVRKENLIKFVRNCHKYNTNISQIAAFTDLTEKEVSDIIAKLEKDE